MGHEKSSEVRRSARRTIRAARRREISNGVYAAEGSRHRRIARQFLAVQEIASDLGLPALVGSGDDLQTLQAILDSGRLGVDDTYLLQSLGIVFGRVLVSKVDGLDWAIVTDEYGTDPTLRYRDTKVCLNVMTAISKRVERGEKVRVARLLLEFQWGLARMVSEVGETRLLAPGAGSLASVSDPNSPLP